VLYRTVMYALMYSMMLVKLLATDADVFIIYCLCNKSISHTRLLDIVTMIGKQRDDYDDVSYDVMCVSVC